MTWTYRTIRRLALFIHLLGGCSLLLAQADAPATLSGTVTDVDGAILPYATVTLYPVATSTRWVTHTDLSGEFFFLPLSTGEYEIIVESPGFATKEEAVHVHNSSLRLSIVLAADAAQTEIAVDATRNDPSAPAHVDITSEQIDRIPTESVSSPFSSLITATTPGVAADSNGSFHPLGDHAEASFVIDGQPITDQQSRTFSTQISLNALQSIEVREGAPGADIGDKTSMVIVAQTRSGLGQRPPHGTIALGRSTFTTSTASANVGFGTARIGSFTAIDTLNSGRFLDTPELAPLHANGNAQNLIERLDDKTSAKTSFQLNGSLSRSWFQTPNTYDQNAVGQNQRQTIVSFNVAPHLQQTLSNQVFHQANIWLRQDKIRYRPSDNPYSDTPAYLQQARRLTNVGVRDALTYNRGHHNVMAGAEFKHTFLAEQFATALTDPTFNSPCLNPDGTPSSNVVVTEPTQCAALGLASNSAFLPSLLPIDLTRGGRVYAFQGSTDIKQFAFWGQDFLTYSRWTLDLGLRFDKYNGLARNHGVQPRVGLMYELRAARTSIHSNYSRVFLTPYNENLIIASSNGPGSAADALGATDGSTLNTGHRNQFNIGFETYLKYISLSGEYFWKFTYGAYDFDVLLNSPLTFPTQFRKSKIDGGLVRLTLNPTHSINGFFTISHVRSRLFGPEVGGFSFTAPYTNVVRPDHDEGLAMNLNLRYQFGPHGPWISSSYRYDGGLVSVATPNIASALQLTGDQQQQMGLHCGKTFATVDAPLRTCPDPIKATRIRIPPAGTENDDKNPSRIAVRNTVDLSMGEDNLIHRKHQTLGVRVEVINLNNTKALYNFLSTFSGTHFLTTRAVTVGLRYSF